MTEDAGVAGDCARGWSSAVAIGSSEPHPAVDAHAGVTERGGSERVAVIGAGYVGLTTAVCLAHLGHTVRCSDRDADKIDRLSGGTPTILEEGLGALLEEGLAAGRLAFGGSNVWAAEGAGVVFLCVPTPQGGDERADMRHVLEAAREVAPVLPSGAVVVNKSTVPVGSTGRVREQFGRADLEVVSNPEFLREGHAIQDFLHPARIVVGADHPDHASRVLSLFTGIDAPRIVADPASAETIKYAANAFLATKVSFANAIAALCEAVGADVRVVAEGIGLDPRVGPAFLRPGPGWGGSCLPKDTAALLRMAEDAGYDFALLRGVVEVNREQRERIVAKTARLAGGELSGSRVALLGLTFKAGTEDLRDSPALAIAEQLAARGAEVVGFDPTVDGRLPGLVVAGDPFEALRGAAVAVVATEWDELASLDWTKAAQLMARPAVVDARNLLDAATMRRAGFVYEGVGVP